jgi:NADH-quinone oxidoreductase subunit G
MPLVKINGVEIEVPEGTNMIEAARLAGEEIPHYCYHPHLTIAGNCRMCTVDVEAGGRGPDIACNMVARDGLAIRTDTENVKTIRAHMMEFLLKNHPLDCPICDQSGECRLQDYYMDHGDHDSRLADPKHKKAKRVDIGDKIMLDAERCVACTRCVRFGDEVTGTGELRLFQRTDSTEIGIFPGEELSHQYQGNLADICPVGALTNKEFRFTKRVWYLRETDSVCTGCATGCNISVCHQQGEVHRFLPRRNDAVNESWMCDPGRATAEKLEPPHRILLPRVEGKAADWDVAAAAALRELGEGGVGVVFGAQATNEANYALLSLARKHLSGARFFLAEGNDPGSFEGSDKLLIDEDKNPNRRGAMLVGELSGSLEGGAALKAALVDGSVSSLLVLQDDVLGRLGVDAPEGLVVLATNRNTTTAAAHVLLPVCAHVETEGTFVNRRSRVQRFREAVWGRGEGRPGFAAVDALAVAAGGSVVPSAGDAVFAKLAAEVPDLAGLSWKSLGSQGQPLVAPAPPEPTPEPASPAAK